MHFQTGDEKVLMPVGFKVHNLSYDGWKDCTMHFPRSRFHFKSLTVRPIRTPWRQRQAENANFEFVFVRKNFQCLPNPPSSILSRNFCQGGVSLRALYGCHKEARAPSESATGSEVSFKYKWKLADQRNPQIVVWRRKNGKLLWEKRQ